MEQGCKLNKSDNEERENRLKKVSQQSEKGQRNQYQQTYKCTLLEFHACQYLSLVSCCGAYVTRLGAHAP